MPTLDEGCLILDMRTSAFVTFGLVLTAGGLVAAQGAPQQGQSQCKDFALITAEVFKGTSTPQRPVTESAAQAVAVGARLGLIERIRKQTGIGVTADCIESRLPGFRAQGNVTLT